MQKKNCNTKNQAKAKKSYINEYKNKRYRILHEKDDFSVKTYRQQWHKDGDRLGRLIRQKKLDPYCIHISIISIEVIFPICGPYINNDVGEKNKKIATQVKKDNFNVMTFCNLWHECPRLGNCAMASFLLEQQAIIIEGLKKQLHKSWFFCFCKNYRLKYCLEISQLVYTQAISVIQYQQINHQRRANEKFKMLRSTCSSRLFFDQGTLITLIKFRNISKRDVKDRKIEEVGVCGIEYHNESESQVQFLRESDA